MRASLLLLADSRLPAGGHAHSGGVEAAVAAGFVVDIATLEAFLRGRLTTAGRAAAGAAACACALALAGAEGERWRVMDGEVSARMPSPAQREASRAQGRGLLRVAGRAWPHPALVLVGDRPHHAVVLGVVVAAAGGEPTDAAVVAVTAAVTGPAAAALRLLGLDPVEVAALTARLGAEMDRIAALPVPLHPGDLPAPGAPMLDVLAQDHDAMEVRLFAS